jgi:starvation-inducible DNA-binding protein
MKMKTNQKEKSTKYGYSNLEKAEIVTSLNKLLASYQIYFHKLRYFYWNIIGQDFFDLHSVFQELCHKTYQNIDDVAERIRFFDKMPLTKWGNYTKVSDIKENRTNLTGFEMVNEICRDMLKLLLIKENCIKTIMEVSDYGTENMIKSLIYEMEKDYRMLSAWKK